MGFEEKTLDLLALLTAHTGGSSPTVVVVTWPPTLAATHTSTTDARDKKRKMAQGGKGAEGTKEREITHSSYQPPDKEAWTRKGQSKKSTSIGTPNEARGDQPRKASIWMPVFTLSFSNPVLDNANLRDPTNNNSSLVVEYLEKALCLLEDIKELRSIRKCEVFLALKQDMAKVCKHFHLIA